MADPMDTDERTTLTYEEAVAFLPDRDEIHTFRNPAPGMMIGCDWERAHVLAALGEAEAEGIGITGGHAQATLHGLVIVHEKQYLFIETVRRTDIARELAEREKRDEQTLEHQENRDG